jgi:hypothetical protein
MGFYWNNLVYYGRLLSEDTLLKMKKHQKYSQIEKYIANIADRIYIIAKRENVFNFSNFDPMIDDNEKIAGVIQMSEVKRVLAGKHDEIFIISEDTAEIFKTVGEILEKETIPNWYMAQTTWCTLEPNSPWYIELNLKIV